MSGIDWTSAKHPVPRWHPAWHVAATLAVLAAGACSEADPPPTSAPNRAGIDPATAIAPLRVVSLSPAISRTVQDLGLEDWLVGRTPYCTGLPEGVAVVGDLTSIDPEALRQVRPDMILVQPAHGGVQPALEELAATSGWKVEPYPIDSLEDLEALIDSLPRVLFSAAGEVSQAQTVETVRRLNAMLASVRAVSAPLSPAEVAAIGRVAVLFSIEPPMAFGAGTFVDGLLGRLGVSNAITANGYPELSLEDLVRIDPDLVILLREQESGSEEAVTALAALGLGRGRGGVERVIDSQALTPGSGWIDAAVALRRVIEEAAARQGGRSNAATAPVSEQDPS